MNIDRGLLPTNKICFFKLFSILLQTYALSILRDDLTSLQQHSSKIPGIEDITEISQVTKRQNPLAVMYWSQNGIIKLVFNVELTSRLIQLAQYSGQIVALGILHECRVRLENKGIDRHVVRDAEWGAQLGTGWPEIFQAVIGAATFAITIKLAPYAMQAYGFSIVLRALRRHFTISGHRLMTQEVPDALTANEAPNPNPKKRSSTIKKFQLAFPRFKIGRFYCGSHSSLLYSPVVHFRLTIIQQIQQIHFTSFLDSAI